MLRLVVIFLVGALVWMVWWAIGQGAYEQGLAAWVKDRRGEGWVADYASLETRGFPNRFDTTVSEVALADPDTGVAWSAPFVQFLSLAYKPHQVIAVLPGEHRVSTPFQTITLTHDDARASLFLEPSTDLGLDRARLVLTKLRALSSTGAELSLDEGRLAAEKLPDPDHTYRLGGEFLGFVPTQEARRLLDPKGALPARVARLRADGDVSFTAPLDRFAIEQGPPQITRLNLRDLSARWGSVDFRAAGQISLDAEGFPEGQITLRVEDWRRVLSMPETLGWLPSEVRPSLETALGLLAGEGDVLDAPLSFANGVVSLGLIPLGDAPRLVIR